VGDDEWKPVILKPVPIRIDASWAFKFMHPIGRHDNVSGFTSESHALDWLRGDGLWKWANNRRYRVSVIIGVLQELLICFSQ
jgi:hypothetical protein